MIKYIIKMGKPTHLMTSARVTACWLAGKRYYAAYDPRDVDCLSCRRTKLYKTAMGVKP